MSDGGHDILMITYNRPHYARLSLRRLLDSCDETMRVWLWQNASHEETVAVFDEFKSDPRVHRWHHSEENLGLREPTNWLLAEARGDYLSKVDDDCLVPEGWGATLRRAHDDEPRFGLLGCWHFTPEDFDPELSRDKLQEFSGHTVLRNLWVGGSGWVMKRRCAEQNGPLREGESFPSYGIRFSRAGWINGWYYPLLYQEHMDDPRAPHTAIKEDGDLAGNLPLSAVREGVSTVALWDAQLREDARLVQDAPLDPAYYSRWRTRMRRALGKLGLGEKRKSA